MTPLVHLIRHGESLHNVQRGYPHRDPPLTKRGEHTTKNTTLSVTPDLVLISPMTRTIQTAMNMFPHLRGSAPFSIPVQIWPDLREANDAICNQGVTRAELRSKFPQFDFSACHEEWDYPAHTDSGATTRAQNVREELRKLSTSYQNIAVITHRGFKAYLVKGRRFGLCDVRIYRFAMDEEARDEKVRMGVNCDTLQEQDFGPTVLVLQGS